MLSGGLVIPYPFRRENDDRPLKTRAAHHKVHGLALSAPSVDFSLFVFIRMSDY